MGWDGVRCDGMGWDEYRQARSAGSLESTHKSEVMLGMRCDELTPPDASAQGMILETSKADAA